MNLDDNGFGFAVSPVPDEEALDTTYSFAESLVPDKDSDSDEVFLFVAKGSVTPADPSSITPQKPKYHCHNPGCGKQFKKWNQCLSHLKSSPDCNYLLREQNKQQLCSVVSDTNIEDDLSNKFANKVSLEEGGDGPTSISPSSSSKKKKKPKKKKKELYPDPFASHHNNTIKTPDPNPNPNPNPNPTPTTTNTTKTLPIDAYESKILQNIQENRVTIIHGETGCGKSSRVPIMCLKNDPRNFKAFVSQPRRIAAKALMDRVRSVEPTLTKMVGMRLGFGFVDQHHTTKLWFCTTGYLTRLLAFHPETFDSHTHLIIDEVHERR